FSKTREVAHPQLFRLRFKDKTPLYFSVKVAHPAQVARALDQLLEPRSAGTNMPLWSMDEWQYLEREVVTDPKGRQWTVALMDVLGQEGDPDMPNRSEEHTSELQSLTN